MHTDRFGRKLQILRDNRLEQYDQVGKSKSALRRTVPLKRGNLTVHSNSMLVFTGVTRCLLFLESERLLQLTTLQKPQGMPLPKTATGASMTLTATFSLRQMLVHSVAETLSVSQVQSQGLGKEN